MKSKTSKMKSRKKIDKLIQILLATNYSREDKFSEINVLSILISHLEFSHKAA